MWENIHSRSTLSAFLHTLMAYSLFTLVCALTTVKVGRVLFMPKTRNSAFTLVLAATRRILDSDMATL